LPLEKQEEILYAISAPVPVCPLWNLLDNKSEEQLPVMIMYRGWHASYEQRRALERELEFAIKDLNAARRSGYKDRMMLTESQTQSRELQAEMIEDFGVLQKRLSEAASTVQELTSELATRQRLSASCAVVAERERSKEQERVDVLARKFKSLQVEEASLKDQLGKAHAEESKLSQELANSR